MVAASSPDISRNNATWFRKKVNYLVFLTNFVHPVDALNMELINSSRYFERALNIVDTWGHTEWRTKCHTIDCAHNTCLLLQKHLTSGTELILIGWKIVPNEEHVQCDHRFASQPLARVRLQEVVRQNGGHNEHGLH